MSATPSETTPAANPTPPVRPENPNVTTLKAAFPDVDAAVISAVLIASSNNLEKAFDGLLGMSDPNFTPEMPTTTTTTTPAPITAPTTEEERQILADEQFARQLAAQSRYGNHQPRSRSRDGQTSRYRQAATTTTEEPERSFLDDELPVLKENLIQGFNETKLKVGSFISNLRSQVQARMDAGNGEDEQQQQRAASRYGAQYGQQQASTNQQGYHGDTYTSHPRASTQYDRDARTLDDDFGELELQDNSGEKTTSMSIPNSGNSKESKELAQSAGIGPSKATPNSSRWQPIAETLPATRKEKDSFALGDDDEE